MQDAILLISTLAVFIFGYFLMKKLDAFLESARMEEKSAPDCGENSLRIGFSNLFMAESISSFLEAYGKRHPNASVRIFSGEEHELCISLETHELDMILLPENSVLPEKTCCHAQKQFLGFTPAVMKYAGLSIEPITQDQIVQQAVWRDRDNSPVMDSLIEHLNRFALNQPQK